MLLLEAFIAQMHTCKHIWCSPLGGLLWYESPSFVAVISGGTLFPQNHVCRPVLIAEWDSVPQVTSHASTSCSRCIYSLRWCWNVGGLYVGSSPGRWTGRFCNSRNMGNFSGVLFWLREKIWSCHRWSEELLRKGRNQEKTRKRVHAAVAAIAALAKVQPLSFKKV